LLVNGYVLVGGDVRLDIAVERLCSSTNESFDKRQHDSQRNVSLGNWQSMTAATPLWQRKLSSHQIYQKY